MMSIYKTLIASLSLVGLALTHTLPAQAESGSGGGTFSQHFTAEHAADFSKAIERSLAAEGTRLAIVFRTGRARDKLPDGVDYTHGGFWVYQPIQRQDGTVMRGYTTWNLFHGDGETLPKTQSYLATDFPFEFVRASAVEDLAVIVPTPELQQRILTMMQDGRYESLHDPDYSLIASPFDDRYQNCNEFLLDVIASAVWETTDYAQLKANLGAHFTAHELSVGPLSRLFGPFVDERLKTRDHRGKAIQTVTYAALASFMLEHGYADAAYTVTPSALGLESNS